MKTMPLTVADHLRAGEFGAAVARMQELCRIQDPEVPVDAEQVWQEFEARRSHLKSVVPPAPFKVTITWVKS